MFLFPRILLAAGACLTASIAAAQMATPAFTPRPSISAPDDIWDFASWDAEHGRLLVAHGADILLIDPAKAGAVRAMGQFAKAHAAIAIPGTNHILVTSGHDDSVRILDADSGTELSRIAVASDPDAAIITPDGKTAYVMDAKAGIVSVIDIANARETGRIALKAGLELPILPAPGLLAVSNEDENEIELADLATGKAAGAIALPGCQGPTGFAFAPKEGIAVASCANGHAAIVNMRQRKMTSLLAIGEGPDTAIWDEAHHRFLVPSGKSGTLAIITLTHGVARVASTVPTEVSARTAAYDPAAGTLYLPAARFQPAPAGQRPAMMPGSFHIVVLGSGRAG